MLDKKIEFYIIMKDNEVPLWKGFLDNKTFKGRVISIEKERKDVTVVSVSAKEKGFYKFCKAISEFGFSKGEVLGRPAFYSDLVQLDLSEA